MMSRRPSSVALPLVSALPVGTLACSGETPPAPPPERKGAAAAGASSPPAPSAASTRSHPDFAVSIPGVLTIRAPDRVSRSHGIGDEPWRASFLVQNETAQPLSVSVSGLELRSDDTQLAPADRAQALPVKSATADGATASIQGGTISFMAPPHKEIALAIEGDTSRDLHVLYHVPYRHEATFAAGDGRVVGRGYTMQFRHPRTANP